MKILITGAGGQLARDLIRSAPSHDHICALTRNELDITRSDQIEDAVSRIKPDWVINTAAYTRVDQAEKEAEQAFAVNRDGPRLMAQALARSGGRLVHYSTDYVFDGEKHSPYATADKPNPINVYGASKLEGEKTVIMALGIRAIIIRSAWLYSGHGVNFVTRMLELMQNRDVLRVVSDQTGTPTWTRSLALATWQLMHIPGLHGIHHFCDSGQANWFEFANAIQEGALRHGLLTRPVDIQPIRSADYKACAKRPAYSVLDCAETWRMLEHRPDDWKILLGQLLAEISQQ